MKNKKHINKSKKKILLIGMTTNPGGLERYIMNLFRNINKNTYIVDFLSQELTDYIAYEDVIKQQGGNIVKAIKRDDNFIRHYFEVLCLLRNKYDVIYYNTLDLANIDYLLLARVFNKKTIRIVHAHNSQMAESNGIRNMLMKIHQKFITKISDKRYACSKLAGDWMFAGKDYQIVNNAIDLNRFHFDSFMKSCMLEQLKLDGKIIWGTVGRLGKQKNPLFLVEIMRYAYALNPNIVFLHIGNGELWDEMVLKIKSYHLENNYFLLGEKKNVEDYYQVMEKFILPSLFEGLPFVVMEAQAMGVPTIISEGKYLTEEMDVHAGCISYISLEKTAKEWADQIMRIPRIPDNKRGEYGTYVKQAGFDLSDSRLII